MTLPRLFVFDLDDTLFPERAYVRTGFDAVDRQVRARWGRTGFAAVAWELYLEGNRGRIFDEVLSRLDLAPDPATVQELVLAYRTHEPAISLFPDVEPVVGQLRAHGCTAIVSDGPLMSQQRKVEALGLARLFHQIVLTDTWGPTFWKPHPRAFQELEAATGCSGPACVYVGDNPLKDFEAPRRLGWWTVRVRRPGGEHAALDGPVAAHAECRSFEDLVGLLERTNVV